MSFALDHSTLSRGTVALLILYPAIDVGASLYDARVTETHVVQLANAAISTIALIAIAIVSRDSTVAVLRVFGAWATVSGLVQLLVAVRRRSAIGLQWAMVLSGGLSMLAGISFNLAADRGAPSLGLLAGYSGLGSVLFLIAALTLRSGTTTGGSHYA